MPPKKIPLTINSFFNNTIQVKANQIDLKQQQTKIQKQLSKLEKIRVEIEKKKQEESRLITKILEKQMLIWKNKQVDKNEQKLDQEYIMFTHIDVTTIENKSLISLMLSQDGKIKYSKIKNQIKDVKQNRGKEQRQDESTTSLCIEDKQSIKMTQDILQNRVDSQQIQKNKILDKQWINHKNMPEQYLESYEPDFIVYLSKLQITANNLTSQSEDLTKVLLNRLT